MNAMMQWKTCKPNDTKRDEELANLLRMKPRLIPCTLPISLGGKKVSVLV